MTMRKVKRGWIQDQGGFTLVELIVTINITFLAVAFMISFYLMINKIFIGTTKKAEEKHVTYDFLYKLEEMLNKSEQYSFEISDSSSQIICSKDTLNFTEGNISGRWFSYLDKIEKYEMKIFFLSGDSLNILNGKANDIVVPGEIKVFPSEGIESISLTLQRSSLSSAEYKCSFYNKPVPYKRFKNL